MKTKTIRIKKRGGGTRLQKVKVLASGKYRFMKNPRGGRRRSSNPSPKPQKRRSTRRMARRKRRRRSSGMTIPLAVVAGIAPGVAMPIQRALEGNLMSSLDHLVNNYTGFTFAPSGLYGEQRFDIARLKNGLLPLVMGVLVHKFVGGTLGVNRILARHKVPFIRI